MKGWLNKPPVVAALALLAFGIVYYNVVRPMLGPSVQPNIDRSFEDTAMMLSGNIDVGANEHAGRPTDWKGLSKLPLSSSSKRDIFRPYVASNVHVPMSNNDELSGTHDSSRSSQTKSMFLKVHAIVFGSGMKYAIIGDKMVQEGERIKDYTVIRIRENTVILQGSSGVMTLQFVKEALIKDGCCP